MSGFDGSNDLTGNRPYNEQESREVKEAERDENRTWHVTVTGGDKDVLDTLISERNPEYSGEERADLLDRQDNSFTVAYEDRHAAKRAADLFQTAGASVDVQAKDNVF
ncbi:hypothetical protein [Streptomyces sp. NBC_00158]|uniref:hypothetical protein n=1 Tax=Streptomyces sp. NBC_00158 TaxID=2903627 RepID=UPI003251CF79